MLWAGFQAVAAGVTALHATVVDCRTTCILGFDARPFLCSIFGPTTPIRNEGCRWRECVDPDGLRHVMLVNMCRSIQLRNAARDLDNAAEAIHREVTRKREMELKRSTEPVNVGNDKCV